MCVNVDQARQDQVRFEPLRAYQDIPMVFSWAIPDIHAYKLNDRGERDISFSILSSSVARPEPSKYSYEPPPTLL